MYGNTKPSSEILYLHKDENDEIFVDSTLHQHHIEGIRFLYKQFKKKQLGVVINNPLGYGNSLQVALFLGAIRHVLDKPILIVCEQAEELNWLEHFQKLTQCYNVGIGAPSPFVKKSIFIKTMEGLELFCRRDWSVMVVDNEAFLKEKALQAKFKADYKIWITPGDIKDDLQTFSSIYKWLFPKEKLDIGNFKPKPGDRVDAVSKAILLDVFLQDIVCRTTLQTPFKNPYENNVKDIKKSSKKNKDSTGTKVKRSKRSLDAASTSNANNNDTESGASATKIPKTKTTSEDFRVDKLIYNDENTKSDDDNKSDEENFYDKPVKYDPFQQFERDLDNVSRDSQDSIEDMEDTSFNTVQKLNRLLENEVPVDIAENPEICLMDSDSNSSSLLLLPKKSDDISQLNNDCIERKQTTPDFLADNIEDEIKEESQSSDVFNIKHDASNPEGTDKNIIEESEKTRKGPDKLTDFLKNEEKIDKNKEECDKMDVEFVIKTNELDKMNEEAHEVIEKSELKESPTKTNLDAKLKEMDERAFKKFQGSILDRLF